MKNYFLISFSVIIMALACDNADGVRIDAALKNQNSALVSDWIGLHLQVIKKTTGVTHVAFSRHFAYTGIALYESLVNGDNHYKSIAGSVNGSIGLPVVPQGKPLYWPAAANAAIAEMLRFFYAGNPESIMRIDSLEEVYYTKYSHEVKNATELDKAVTYGQQVAATVINWSKQDGADGSSTPYTTLGEGFWEPTPPAFAPANVPGWGNNRTILPGSIHNTLPPAPVAFSIQPGSLFYTMAKEVYDVSQSLTETQKAIATFWDDAPNGKYVTVFGHWFSIFRQALETGHVGLMKAADTYLRLGVTMHDAAISCWKAKYTYHLIRPVTYIRKHMGFENWNAYITTPPHPEYSAAHATISSSAAYALESVFGPNYAFTDHTYDALGMTPRSFSNFDAAGKEAGLSRLYGGIHYRPSAEAGNAQGKKVGENVNQLLKTRN